MPNETLEPEKGNNIFEPVVPETPIAPEEETDGEENIEQPRAIEDDLNK